MKSDNAKQVEGFFSGVIRQNMNVIKYVKVPQRIKQQIYDPVTCMKVPRLA